MSAKELPQALPSTLTSSSEGNDGSWSTFNIRVGTPAQSVRVLISTNSPDTLVVLPAGCTTDAIPLGVPSNCASAGGGTFNNNDSTTWIEGCTYGFEANLRVNMNADYGMETLGLGYQSGLDSPTLENQTVAAYALPNPYYMCVKSWTGME